MAWRMKPQHRSASLPVRGAWIEISEGSMQVRNTAESLPVRGAWIEMSSMLRIAFTIVVAPRAGSVD